MMGQNGQSKEARKPGMVRAVTWTQLGSDGRYRCPDSLIYQPLYGFSFAFLQYDQFYQRGKHVQIILRRLGTSRAVLWCTIEIQTGLLDSPARRLFGT